jgi:hypothetical protein
MRVGSGAETAADVLRARYEFLDMQAGRKTQSGQCAAPDKTPRPFVSQTARN